MMHRFAFNLMVATLAFTLGVGVAKAWRWAWAAPQNPVQIRCVK